MCFIEAGSFETGFVLAQILRAIALFLVNQPSISVELLQIEQRLKQLKEDICSNNVAVHSDEAILIIDESFRKLEELKNSLENEQ